jgi:multiple sugar transport system permease protein
MSAPGGDVLPGALAVPPERPLDQAARESARLGRSLVVPLLVAVGVLFVYPLVRGFQTSLKSSSLYGPSHFVGLRNYGDVIHDPTAVSSILRTLEYLGFAVTLELTLGLVFAVSLHRVFAGRGIVLAVLILPWALPSVVSGVLWRRIFDPDNGLLNSALLHLHVIHRPQVWLATGTLAIVLITIVHVWGALPLITLILLAGLQSIPEEVYSASAVDGAGALRQFRYITLPLLRSSLAVALTIGSLWAIGIFDEIYVLNGTALNTRSILMQVYNTTFADADFAHGTAFAFLLAGVTAVLGSGYLFTLRSRTP